MSPDQIQQAWNKLPKSAKKVLIKIHKLDLKYEGDVYVLVATLSKWCNIARSTTYDAISRLRDIGWLASSGRPGQSNQWFIAEFLKPVKFTFSRVKIGPISDTYNYPDSYNFYVHKESPSAPPVPPSAVSASPNVPISQEKEKEQHLKWFYSLPDPLQKKFMWDSYDYKRFGWVFKKLSEQKMYELINDFTWYLKQKKPTDPAKLIFSLALKLYKGKNLCTP